jgi:hypothetical protein
MLIDDRPGLLIRDGGHKSSVVSSSRLQTVVARPMKLEGKAL